LWAEARLGKNKLRKSKVLTGFFNSVVV
jgi:hypothetical protein